ncbi:MAG: YbaK/EbsC family protein [Anaerolineae bacterium]|nr:YbaK/EbsC family protein [Anaerolineae bacterium]
MLTATDLSTYITQHGIRAEMIPMPVETPTVADAARALGVRPEQIVKTVVFLIDGRPHLVIACGLGRISQGLLAARFGLSKKRVRLAPSDVVLAETGYPVGTMPPFGHAQTLPTLLDRHVLDQEEVFGGGGAIDYLLRIRPDELLRATQAQVIAATE